MGLINLRTNLKSLRFGNDTQGGGASGLPYIQTGLPEDSPSGEYLASIARNSADWPLRGGQYWTVASTEDAVRVSRFLTDFPKGTTFTTKQVQLQKSNPKIETGGLASRLNTQTYNLNANLLAQVLEQGSGIHIPRAGANTNELGPDNPQSKYEYIVSNKDTNQNRLVTLYNTKINTDTAGLSLDATVTKLGISAFDDNLLFDYVGGPDSLYGDGNTTIFRTTNTKDSFEDYTSKGYSNTKYNPSFRQISPTTGINYLETLGLTDYIKVNQIGGLVEGLYKTKTTRFNATPFSTPTTANNASLNTPFVPTQVDLSGGVENIDFTDNPFGDSKYPKSSYQQSSPDFIRPEQTPTEFKDTINQFNNTMGYSKLLAAKDNDLVVFGKTQDFRSNTNDPIVKALASTVSYNTGGPNDTGFKIESRIGVGNPGARPHVSRSNFYDEYKDGQDQINMSPIYKRDITIPVENDSPAVRDLIKFCIEAIDNNSPKETERMHFRAYITNFSDNIGAEWDSKRYMGRGENFYTYQGFTRDVGFTFIVAAQSVQEMEKIYQKVNYLASTLHPDYQAGTGFMRGSLHKLTIGEYFYRTTGIITSMNITVEDNYPWEIKMRQPELRKKNNGGVNASGDQLQMEVPQILKIQMNFKPIMDKLPQRGLKEPIIVSEAIANNYLSRKDFAFSNLLEKAPIADAEPTSPSLSSTDTVEKPPITTTTNDVNTPPPAATTTTQAPPTDSWVAGSVYVSNSVTGPAGTARWEVRRAAQQGFFYWDVTSPDGSVSSSSPSSLVNNVINDAQIEATSEAGL